MNYLVNIDTKRRNLFCRDLSLVLFPPREEDKSHLQVIACHEFWGTRKRNTKIPILMIMCIL